MKKMYFILMAFACLHHAMAQDVFITRHGQVSFFGKTPLENIDATNNEASSVLNLQTGEIGFAVLIKTFILKRH